MKDEKPKGSPLPFLPILLVLFLLPMCMTSKKKDPMENKVPIGLKHIMKCEVVNIKYKIYRCHNKEATCYKFKTKDKEELLSCINKQ